MRYGRLYGYLQDDSTLRRASVKLVLDLLCERGPERLLQLARFSDDAPLFAYELLKRVPESAGTQTSLLDQALAADEAIVAWLLGEYRPYTDLAGHAVLVNPRETGADRVLASKAWPVLRPVLR